MNLYSIAYKTIHKLKIRSSAILVFYDLCRRANRENECWPSKQTIAKACHISVSTVTRSLRELENAGMIVTVNRYRDDNNRQTSNCYKVFETPQDFTQHSENLPQKELPKQQSINDIFEKDIPEVCEETTPSFIGNAIYEFESPASEEMLESGNYSIEGNRKADKPLQDKQNTLLLQETNYNKFSTFQLLLCFIKANFDTLSRVSATPQGTISRKKVTNNLRNKSIFTKVAKWYRKRKQKNDAGRKFCPALNE